MIMKKIILVLTIAALSALYADSTNEFDNNKIAFNSNFTVEEEDTYDKSKWDGIKVEDNIIYGKIETIKKGHNINKNLNLGIHKDSKGKTVSGFKYSLN